MLREVVGIWRINSKVFWDSINERASGGMVAVNTMHERCPREIRSELRESAERDGGRDVNR